jgi:hypothetical protein
MSTVSDLAEKIRHELENLHPQLRKTILKKLPLLVAVMLEAQTANTAELAAILPLATPRGDMRLQWISRLLSNPLLVSNKIIEPFARRLLAEAGTNGQVILLAMDQEKLGDRFMILMVSAIIGSQTFPLAWRIETAATSLGFDWQRIILEQVATWLPEGAIVRLTVDRSSPVEGLFHWLQARGWQYRLRLQGNTPVSGNSKGTTAGELLKGVTGDALESDIRLFDGGVTTNVGAWQESEREEPQIIAMDCPPTSVAVRDQVRYQDVDAVFSGFRSKGFSLKDTQLHYAIRIDHLVLIMSLAMYWCKHTEYQDSYCQSIQSKSALD